MKAIKIISFTILTLVGFMFMGELNILNLDTFQHNYYSADFYADNNGKKVESREMIRDFCDAGEKHNVDFFAVVFSWDKSYVYDTRIIGTDAAIDYLIRQGISEGNNKSLFFENQNISFEKFKDQEDVSSINEYYFIGGEAQYENIVAFKSELVDKYGGGFPREKGSEAQIILTTIAVWGTILLIIAALSLYELSYKRKENMIRAIMGENLVRITVRDIVVDTFACSFIFFLWATILKAFSNVTFKFDWTLGCFFVFLIVNGLIDLRGLRANYKQVLSGGENENSTLTVNYLLKAILTVVTIIVLSTNYLIIDNAINVYEQREFFDKHDNYSYYKMSYGLDAVSENHDPDENLYQRFYEQFYDCSYQYTDMTENYEMSTPLVMINRKAFIELSREYEEIRNAKVEENSITLLLPKGITPYTNDYESAKSIASEYGEWNIDEYDGEIMVEGIHCNGVNYAMNMYKNPMMIIDNSTKKNETTLRGYDAYYNYDIMYSIPEPKWKDFKSGNKIPEEYVSVTNVKDEYVYEWMQHKRKMALTIILSIFILFLEFALMVLIIRMEYQFNAVEMALMKVHGYSLAERNTRLISGSIIFGLMGIIVALVLSIITNLPGIIVPIIVIGAGLVLCEIIFVFLKAQSLEKRKISTILKGEWI